MATNKNIHPKQQKKTKITKHPSTENDLIWLSRDVIVFYSHTLHLVGINRIFGSKIF